MVYFSRLMLSILVSTQLVSCTAHSFFKTHSKTVQFLDYEEKRDLKNIARLYEENTEKSSGSVTLALKFLQEQLCVDCVKVAYFGSEFIGFIMYGFPENHPFFRIKRKDGTYGPIITNQIHALVIEKKFRKKGYDHTLLGIVKTELEEKGVELIDVFVSENNEELLKFYHKNCFYGYNQYRELLFAPRDGSVQLACIINKQILYTLNPSIK